MQKTGVVKMHVLAAGYVESYSRWTSREDALMSVTATKMIMTCSIIRQMIPRRK